MSHLAPSLIRFKVLSRRCFKMMIDRPMGGKGLRRLAEGLAGESFKLWLKRAMIGPLSIYECGRPLLCPDCNRTASPSSMIRPSKPSKSTVTSRPRFDRVSFLTWSFLGSISYEYLLEVPISSLYMPKLMCYPTPCVTSPAMAKRCLPLEGRGLL